MAVLGDLPGPKIRLVEVEGDGFDLIAGSETTFARSCQTVTSAQELGCHGNAVDWVQPGHRVLINGGRYDWRRCDPCPTASCAG